MKNLFDKILNWYFTKNALPYWSIFLIDCLIIVCSGLLTYWIFNNAEILLGNVEKVLSTLLCFVVLSIPGFRLFHTYSGFMRYASFIDLMRVAYGNAVSLVLVLLDTEQSITHSIAKDLCKRFHQESVLITEDPIRGCFVNAGDD